MSRRWVMYRDLKSTMDDMCDDRPFRAWAAAQPVPIDTSNWGGVCFLFNPGIANSFQVDLNGDGILENPSLSKEALRYDKAKRKYTALDLFLEHPLRDKWYGKVNYTYSKTTGNTEGLLLSDIGRPTSPPRRCSITRRSWITPAAGCRMTASIRSRPTGSTR